MGAFQRRNGDWKMDGKHKEWAELATPEQFLKDWYLNVRTHMIRTASMWHQACQQDCWTEKQHDGAKLVLDGLAQELEAIKRLEVKLDGRCVKDFAVSLYLLDGLGPDHRENW